MDMNDFHYTDGLDDVLAAYVNRLMDSTLRSEYKNIETLSADRELTDADTPIQRLDCNGADRVVKVPMGAVSNHLFLVINTTGAGAWTLSVKSNDGATTHQVLHPGSSGLFVPNGNGGYLPISVDLSLYLQKSGLTEWDEQAGDPPAPSDGKWKLYFKAGGLYLIDDAGVVIGPLGTGGGGGAVPHAPGGRPTLVAGEPVMTSEQANKTRIYYEAYISDLCPIWSGAGAVWQEHTIPQIYLDLDSNAGHTGYHQLDKCYFLFVVNDGGTYRLGTGPAWASDTNPGTGAGTSELKRKNGIKVNKYAMTLRYGNLVGDTLSVAAEEATAVGAFKASANGQTTWELGGINAGGDPAWLYLCSMYNLVEVSVTVRDNTDSWTSTVNAFECLNKGVSSGYNNRASFMRASNDDDVYCALHIPGMISSNGNAGTGIGLDRVNGNDAQILNNGTFSSTFLIPWHSIYSGKPGLGFHYLQALQHAGPTGATVTWFGDTSAIGFIQSGLLFKAKM